MPALSAPNAVLWRKPYSSRVSAYISRPAIIFAARVNMASATYPLKTLTFDTVTTGAYTAIKPGYTLLLGSAAGLADKGMQRVRAATTSTTIPVGRSSRGVGVGELDVADNLYITVLKERRIWAKIPNIVGATLYKDEQAYSNALALAPVAVAGPDYANLVDDTTALITVAFDATGSYSPNGLSIASYLWDLDGGTVTAGTLASSTLTATFPAGEYDISLTVTDSAGRAHTTYRWVVAATKTGAYRRSLVEMSARTLRFDGQTGQIVIRAGSVPKTTSPTGTRAILWERERYGADAGSLAGPSGREHVKGSFWLGAEATTISAQREGVLKSVTLELLDAAARLKQIPGFAYVLHRKSAASKWSHAQSATANINGFILRTLRDHTTALELADFSPAAYGNLYTFSLLNVDKASPFEQADKRAQAIRHRLTCDSRGRLAVKPYPNYLPTAAQAAEFSLSAQRTGTVIVDVTASDWSDVTYSDAQVPGLHWTNGSAIQISTQDGTARNRRDTPLFCISPGETPGQGVNASDSGEQLAISQAELNAVEGNRYRTNNAEQSLFEWLLTHGGDAGIEPALMEWVTFTISAAAAAQRGLTLSSERMLPVEVAIDYDGRGGFATRRVTTERERAGTPATTVIKSANGGNFPLYVSPTTYYSNIDYTPAPIAVLPTAGSKNIAPLCDNGLALTTGFDVPSADGGPNYAQWFPWASIGVSGIFLQWVPHGAAPGSGRVITSTGIYYLNLATATVTLLYTFAHASTSRSADGSFHGGAPNWFMVISSYESSGGTECVYSIDGTTFFAVTIDSHYENSAPYVGLPGVYVSQHTPGLAYTTAWTSTASFPLATADGFKTVDYGAHWTAIGGGSPNIAPGALLGFHLHGPYLENDGDTIIYHTHTINTAQHELRRTSGASYTSIAPVISAHEYIPYDRDTFMTAFTNPSRALMVGIRDTAPDTFAVFKCDDADTAATWTVVDASGSNYRHCAIDGNNEHVFFLWGIMIGYSEDDGVTIDDRTGNLLSYTPGTVKALAGW
jgi:hypothetical protein